MALHQGLKTTSMAAPWVALLAGLAASRTEFEDDVDISPIGGRCWWVRHRQHPPPSLKMTSMAGPPGGVVVDSGSVQL
jgi:hypothetical protein